MQFLSHYLLSGLVLAAVPLIIHFLNRRRFRLVNWAPMRYLHLTLKTNRPRMKLEQWLLLLLRTLLIAALILAIARPTVSGTGLGAWLARRNRSAHVLVLDDSLGMGYRNGGRSAWQTAQEAAAKLIESIGAQDSVTVLVTSDLERSIVRDAHLTDPTDVVEHLRTLKVSHTASDWQAAFEMIDKHLSMAAYPLRQVTVITDFRRQGWTEGVSRIADGWADESISLTLVDVGRRDTGNVALVGLEQEDPVALPGAATRFVATVRNDQGHATEAVPATLTLGSQARTVLLPRLGPGRQGQVPLSIIFDVPGQQTISLAIPDDALPQDNTRWLCVDVRARLDLMLVDGEPHDRPFESETDFLALAFTVGGTAWRVYRMIDSEWLAAPMGRPDLLILANVATIRQERITAIERMVRGGLGLMVFAGDQIDLAGYNEHLYRDGTGLLPARLDRVQTEPVMGLVLEPIERSALRVMQRLMPAALARIGARQFLSVRLPEHGEADVRVLARWNDPQDSPAVIEKSLGRGRVLLWTSTADKAWTDWPIGPTYLLAMREAAIDIVRGGSQRWGVTAGHPILVEMEENEKAVEARVSSPGAQAAGPLLLDNSDAAGEHLRYTDTKQAGIYSIRWTNTAGQSKSRLFAVNPDRSESNLEPIEPEQLLQWMEGLRPVIVRDTELDATLAGPGRELWRSLVMLLLALVVVESALAMWVGRQH